LTLLLLKLVLVPALVAGVTMAGRLGLLAAALSALVAQLSLQGLILWRMSARSSPKAVAGS
jgi:hypothetical protein